MSHISHLLANYRLYQELGEYPTIFLNKKYKGLKELDNFNTVFFSKKSLLNIKSCDLALFWFPSISNIFLLLFLKIKFQTKSAYVYHEPFDSLKNYSNSGFSILDILKKILITFFSDFTAKFSDLIILPSEKAIQLYKANLIKANNTYSYIPLIFLDELNKKINIDEKKYISFIGTASPDHSFDVFLDYILYALDKNIFSNYKFMIATRTDLSEIINRNKNFKKAIEEGKILLKHGSFMSNEEINNYFYKSVLVWNAYSRSTQSGVLPKAYMFGCPVIVLKKNRSEYLLESETGISINDDYNYEEITNAIKSILANKSFFINSSRNFFLNIFFYKNMKNKYLNLLD